MENQNQTTSPVHSAPDIKTLETDMKSAFKAGDCQQVEQLAKTIKSSDPENHLAAKLLEKINQIKQKEEAQKKAERVKEYENMLRILNKQGDSAKMRALAQELKEFDPNNKSAEKWIAKADKLEGKADPDKSGGGFFSRLFSKKVQEQGSSSSGETKKEESASDVSMTSQTPPASASAVNSAITAPRMSVAENATPPNSVALSAAPETLNKSAETVPLPALASPSHSQEKTRGNTFTRMFGRAAAEPVMKDKSVIDQIVAKTERSSVIEKKPLPAQASHEKKPVSLLPVSRFFVNFTAVFIIFTAAFLYVEYLDKENTFLGFVGISENTGSKLHGAAEELTLRKRQEAVLEKDIALYKGGYGDASLKTVQQIISERVDWVDVLRKIKEVTNSVFELNDFFKYIEYNNYAFDAQRGIIRVTGTLTDPLGRNLTRLVELEEAFKYYPKDKNNPEDHAKPYFKDVQEFSTLSKSLDAETGRYTSSFQLSFSLNK